MNDSYAEWLVKRKAPAYTIIIKIFLAVLCVLSAFFAMMTVFGIIVLVLVGIATYFIFLNLNLEFEYLVVNDQITVDKVMGKARRKKEWEGVLENVQIIAPLDSYVVKDYEAQNMTVLDYSSHMPHARVYALIHQKDGQTTKILFEPNDKILQCIRNRSPRKVIL